ncbi:MAG: MBL fold metallo-hydrolase [Gammaproteobacteria bacterium]|nr:MBL fold metallo-hydrolase [Gammaproteobacteria bacterium]MDD9896324.1 MBL fold metallo-hydrolase [Gammaproteobacteria bacterium]MDD9959231.1 MBL fold metallo-hydrolase [Gammaproteobacteria bacterium]
MRRILILFLFSHGLFAQDGPYIYVLGVVQDAGYPQIGCYQPHCMPAWENPAMRRGATSIAVIEPQSKNKYLFEATPHVPSQLYLLEQEAPDSEYTLSGVFLTHAHIGHYTGLMFFGFEAMNARELPVYAMPRMAEYLANNGPWSQLIAFENIHINNLQADRPVHFDQVDITPYLVPHRDEFSETVGYRISGPQRAALFIPDINKWEIWERDIVDEVRAVDYALIDASFYDSTELPGRNMADIPHPFVVESMALFEELTIEERNKVWFIHLNHTNPLLDEESSAYQSVREQGYNVAREGDRLPL